MIAGLKRFWSEIITVRGEVAGIHEGISRLAVMVARLGETTAALVKQTAILVKERKIPCFVTGTGRGKDDDDVLISSRVAWLNPGDRVEVMIAPQTSLTEVVIGVDEPFVFVEAMVGVTSKMWATRPSYARELALGDVPIESAITLIIEYPAEK